MVKKVLISSVILMMCFAVAASWSMSTPTERVIQETQAKYTLQGQFTPEAYTISTRAEPFPNLFPSITEDLRILFTCKDIDNKTVAMKVILEDQAATWQKELPVALSGDSIVSFPLDLRGLLNLGNTINGELGAKGNVYLLKIVADVGEVNEPFEVVLKGQLYPNILIWDQAETFEFEKGFPGTKDWIWGSFGLTAKLKDNTLFGPVILERQPVIPEYQALPENSVLFLSLVRSMDINYDFAFISDAKLESISGDYSVDMVFSEAGRWSRTLSLIDKTPIQSAFNFTIPVDIGKIEAMADEINQEIGGRAAGKQDIIVTVQVHSIASTPAGVVDETFTHQLNGTISDKVEWDTSQTGQDLKLAKNGEITKQVAIPVGIVQFLRILSMVGLGLTAGLFLVLGYTFLRAKRPGPTLIDLHRKNKKKYGQLISEISDLPPLQEDENIIQVPSLEDLANIANNSLNPIFLKIGVDRLDYIVIVGLKRYSYSIS